MLVKVALLTKSYEDKCIDNHTYQSHALLILTKLANHYFLYDQLDAKPDHTINNLMSCIIMNMSHTSHNTITRQLVIRFRKYSLPKWVDTCSKFLLATLK